MPDGVTIERIGRDFRRWDALLSLILTSFAYMEGLIDPPSSVHRLTPESLEAKAAGETGFVALDGDAIAGCVFLADRGDHLYLGKLAVDPDYQGRGIGRALLAAAERHAAAIGRPAIMLQARIELTGNHATFSKMGFREVARTAHEGFDRPTSITFRKDLDIGSRPHP